jgi:pimeloyl-ACP methyl ester carboxylesterase
MLPDSLRSLKDATAQLAHGHQVAGLAAVDAFTSSRVGFTALLEGRYRITADGTEWDSERLSSELAAASGSAIAYARHVAQRSANVGRLMSFSDGSDRRELFARLSNEQKITSGSDPYRPVNVAVTGMKQRQIALSKDHGRAQLRLGECGSPGAPPLLLLHGHASRIEEYEVLAPLLGKDFHVFILDMLGSGYAEKPDVDYSIDNLQPMLEDAMSVLGLKDVRVAGGGLGGNLALRLAYRDGLLGGAHRITKVSAWSVAGWGETKPLLSTGARLLRHAPDGIFYTVAEQQLGEQYAPSYPDRDAMIQSGMAYRREVHTRNFQDAYFCIAADQVGTTMLPHANEIAAPVQLLAGELDTGRLGIRSAVEHLASVRKQPATIIQGSGYAVANEQPARLATAIATFLLA